jgi:hypothetical protein
MAETEGHHPRMRDGMADFTRWYEHCMENGKENFKIGDSFILASHYHLQSYQENNRGVDIISDAE